MGGSLSSSLIVDLSFKSGHETVVRLLEEHSANQPSSKSINGGGGSSSATSITSNSTAETKPSSAILNPMAATQYSPTESPDSTKRRSCVSLGNNSSNSKSSSNLTGSTKSDHVKFSQSANANQVIKVGHIQV